MGKSVTVTNCIFPDVDFCRMAPSEQVPAHAPQLHLEAELLDDMLRQPLAVRAASPPSKA